MEKRTKKHERQRGLPRQRDAVIEAVGSRFPGMSRLQAVEAMAEKWPFFSKRWFQRLFEKNPKLKFEPRPLLTLCHLLGASTFSFIGLPESEIPEIHKEESVAQISAWDIAEKLSDMFNVTVNGQDVSVEHSVPQSVADTMNIIFPFDLIAESIAENFEISVLNAKVSIQIDQPKDGEKMADQFAHAFEKAVLKQNRYAIYDVLFSECTNYQLDQIDKSIEQAPS